MVKGKQKVHTKVYRNVYYPFHRKLHCCEIGVFPPGKIHPHQQVQLPPELSEMPSPHLTNTQEKCPDPAAWGDFI